MLVRQNNPIQPVMTFHHERRFDRALYHLESLKAEVRAWEQEGPYRTWTDLDVNVRYKLTWVEVTKPPPRNLSVVVGDCLHNLRATLDNLAFELALAHTGEPLPSNIEGKSAFPIFRTRTDENVKKLNRMLRGVHPCARALIEGLQPYERGDRFPNDPLWQLNQLSNEDKHRLPHVVLFAQMGMTYFVPGALLTEDIEPIFGNIERRAPIARYPAFDKTDAEVDVHGRPRISVGFGQRSPRNLWGMPVPVRLSVISEYILTNVLRPLHPYLTEMPIVQVSQPYCLLRDKSLGI